MTFYFLKPKTIIVELDSRILTLTFLRGKCNEKLYRLNLALILIGQFMWAEQIKSYNGNTITGDLKFSLRVGYGSFFVFRCTLDTDKFDISINVFSLNMVMFQLY
jgi:hypothetical protein